MFHSMSPSSYVIKVRAVEHKHFDLTQNEERRIIGVKINGTQTFESPLFTSGNILSRYELTCFFYIKADRDVKDIHVSK